MISTFSRIPRWLEEPISQEEEFQWRYRALDRHLNHVNHQPTALPELEETAQRRSPFNGVKIEDVLTPAAIYHPRGFLRAGLRAGGDHQVIVVDDLLLALQAHQVLIRLDQLDIGEYNFHRGRQEVALGLDHIAMGSRCRRG